MMKRFTFPSRSGALFYFGIMISLAIYLPFMSVYFSNLGFNGRQIGILSGVGPLMCLIAAPIVSTLADLKRSRIPMLAILLAGSGVGMLVLGLQSSFIWVLLLLAVMTFFRSPINPLSDAIIVRLSSHYNLDYGKMRLWGSIGYAVVSLLCGWIWQQTGIGMVWFVAGGVSLLSIGLVRLLKDPPQEDRPQGTSFRSIRWSKPLVAVYAASFLVGAGLVIAETFQGVNIERLGGDKFLVGLAAGLSAVCEVPAMRLGADLGRRFGGLRVLLGAIIMIGSAYTAYGLATQPWMMVVAAGFKGVGWGLYIFSIVILIDELGPPEWSGTLQSLRVAGEWGLAPLIAGPIGGYIYDIMGPTAAFSTSGLLIGGAALVLFFASIKGHKHGGA